MIYLKIVSVSNSSVHTTHSRHLESIPTPISCYIQFIPDHYAYSRNSRRKCCLDKLSAEFLTHRRHLSRTYLHYTSLLEPPVPFPTVPLVIIILIEDTGRLVRGLALCALRLHPFCSITCLARLSGRPGIDSMSVYAATSRFKEVDSRGRIARVARSDNVSSMTTRSIRVGLGRSALCFRLFRCLHCNELVSFGHSRLI